MLSQQLQKRSTTLCDADNLVKRTIRVIQSMKELPGDNYTQALTAARELKFRDVDLIQMVKLYPLIPHSFCKV